MSGQKPQSKIQSQNFVLKNENIDITKINPIILTNNHDMQVALHNAKNIADIDSNVLITGETGVGKELLAILIHNDSLRKSRKCLKVNCAAIPDSLFESEAFGHLKGAFTGASADRAGFFEEADKSTLILDEIGELPLHNQAKLLRIIQDKEVRRLGGSKTIQLDFRLICITNRDLKEEIKNKNFRDDLFYRINECEIQIPALRDRKEDFLPLIFYFINKYNLLYKKQIKTVNYELAERLLLYRWPGNVREFEHTIKKLIREQQGDELTPENLPQEILSVAVQNQSSVSLTEELKTSGLMKDIMNDFQKKIVIDALSSCYGSRTEAAQKLGITKEHISRLIKKYDIQMD